MEEIINYYVKLLILQYRNKPKAKGTIESLAKALFEDINGEVFLLNYQNSYDLDTSLLAQLNTLAKYIGFSDRLYIIQDEYFKLSDYNATDETPGLSSYDGANVGYPLLSYAGYTYIEQSVTNIAGISFFRNVLKFLTEMKNETVSLESLDRLLYKYFGYDLYVEEGNKVVTYMYSDNLLETFDSDIDLLEAFIKKYMPKPMGCGISIQNQPHYLNLKSFGGATVDEDFIFKMDSEDESKYFLTPNDMNFSVNDRFEICLKVKINANYELSGFCQTEDPITNFSLLKRRADHTFTISAYGYDYAIMDYTGYTGEWVKIIVKREPAMYGGLLATVIFNNQEVASNVQIPLTFYYSGKFQFGIGNMEGISTYGFIGEMDFKECYIKKNGEYVWRGLTNRKEDL